MGDKMKRIDQVKLYFDNYNGGCARSQVELILLNNNIQFNLLESPLERANKCNHWLASFNGEPAAEVKLTEETTI